MILVFIVFFNFLCRLFYTHWFNYERIVVITFNLAVALPYL